MAKIVSVNNQKGGVGKTTTALAMASVLTDQGKKVLLVDCDGSSQSLTKNILKQLEQEEILAVTLSDLILTTSMGYDAEAKTRTAIIHSPKGYDLLPADDKLVTVSQSLAMQNNLNIRFHTMENILKAVSDKYDYILMDSAPVLDIFSLNQLIAADELIIVTQCQKASVEAVYELLKSVEDYVIPQKPNFKISGILPTMLDKRERYSEKTLENFKMELTDIPIFKTVIPFAVHAKRCVDTGKAITDYDKTSKVAIAYREFVDEWKGVEKCITS